jgi:lipopolysaccharide transport system ATP-binding protein
VEACFDEIVEFSGVRKFLDVPVKRYSSGMIMRLAFSIAAHVETEILLIDEVLAVGFVEFQEKCLARIRRAAASGVAILIITHSLCTVSELCSRGLYLSSGRLTVDGTLGQAVHACENYE